MISMVHPQHKIILLPTFTIQMVRGQTTEEREEIDYQLEKDAIEVLNRI
jgi:hypothetical protein